MHRLLISLCTLFIFLLISCGVDEVKPTQNNLVGKWYVSEELFYDPTGEPIKMSYKEKNKNYAELVVSKIEGTDNEYYVKYYSWVKPEQLEGESAEDYECRCDETWENSTEWSFKNTWSDVMSISNGKLYFEKTGLEDIYFTILDSNNFKIEFDVEVMGAETTSFHVYYIYSRIN